jgi:hypothetical protein
MSRAATCIWSPSWRNALLLLACIAWFLVPVRAAARPEKIRPGHPHYSDDYTVEGLVHDIAEERNFEEVYQNYRYFEAVYDEAGRVVVFKEYERGEVIRAEEYRYGPDGALLERIVRQPGEPTESTSVDHAERDGLH